MICATPSGSTAYNLSNGGPVLVRGLDAMAITFIAPHSLHARPLVVPRGLDADRRQPRRRRPGRRARRRPPGRRDRRRAASVAIYSLRAAEPARDAAGDDVLPALPRDFLVLEATASRRTPSLRWLRAPPPPHRESRPHPGGGARARARAERDHGRDRRGEDDPRAGGRAPARREGRRRVRRPGRREAYVEAELDLPRSSTSWPSCARTTRTRSLVARRVFGDGRTRAYAWGRAAAREDVAAAVEQVVAMSGQFEQRRLARPSYQLEVLDRFCGDEQLSAGARGAGRLARAPRRAPPPRGAHRERRRRRGSARRAPRARRGHRRHGARREDALRDDRERLRHVSELAEAAAAAARGARRPTRGGRCGSRRLAERARGAARAPRARAPARRRRAARRRAAPARDGIGAARVPRGARGGAGRLEQIEAASTGSPMRSAASAARPTRSCSRGRPRPRRARGARRGRRSRRARPRRSRAAEARVRDARRSSCAPSGTPRAGVRRCGRVELHDVGMGDGEFVCELRERESRARPAPTRRCSSCGRTPACRSAPVARPPRAASSRGSRSRSPPSPAARPRLRRDRRGHRRRDANAVGRVLQRLAERAQVITITHLPQIAALADRHFRVEKVPATRPTRDRAARAQSARPSSSGCSAARSSLLRYAADRMLLAPIDDVWAFLAEPYHLADWWPASPGSNPTAAGSHPGRAGRSAGRTSCPTHRSPGSIGLGPARRPGSSGISSSPTSAPDDGSPSSSWTSGSRPSWTSPALGRPPPVELVVDA